MSDPNWQENAGPSAAWDQFWEDARSADILEGAQRLLGAKLKHEDLHWVGPCPAGCAKRDGFIVTPAKGRGIFLCRPSGASGGVIDMVMHGLGCSKIEAAEKIMGRSRPDRSRDETSDELNARLARNAERQSELERRKEEQRRGEEEQRRIEEAEERREEEAIAKLRKRAVDLEGGHHGDSYFKARELIPDKRLDIKFISNLEYWGRRGNGDGKIVRLETLPALIAVIRDASGAVIGLSRTYLDRSEPGKWTPIGSPSNRARKILGEKKGGLIRLGRPSETLAISEGYENALAWMQLHPDYEGGLAAAVDLGNLASVVLPEGVRHVIIVADADSEPKAMCASVRKAIENFQNQGAEASMDWPTPGCDWNDVLLHEVRGEPLREDVEAATEALRALRHPGGTELAEQFIERVGFLFDRPQESGPEPSDRGAPPIGEGNERPKPNFRTLAEFISEFRPISYAVAGLMREGSLYTFTGRTGEGKTAFLVMLALSIATGQETLFGHKVKQGRVAYATAGNPDDLRMRLMIACYVFNIDPAIIDRDLIISDNRVRPEEINDWLKGTGEAFTLIIIDTWQAYFDGNNSNIPAEAVSFTRRFRPLAAIAGAPVVIIAAHPVKQANDDNLIPYGGGSTLNEVDGNFTILRDESALYAFHWLGKIRGLPFDPLHFKIDKFDSPDVVTIEGDRVPMPLMSPIGEKAVEERKTAVADKDIRLLEALAEHPGMPATWLAHAAKVPRGSVDRMLQRLGKKRPKIIENTLGKWRVTEAGFGGG